ncbi:hypothetical protein AB4Z21_25615, partial [Paenibacillus sp. MCAF20]
KSSILSALNYLLNDIKKITVEEFFSFLDEGTATNIRGANKIVMTYIATIHRCRIGCFHVI